VYFYHSPMDHRIGDNGAQPGELLHEPHIMERIEAASAKTLA
jgi:hypothetical protein